MYKLGGVYLDIKSKLRKPLLEVIKPTDSCILDTARSIESWRRHDKKKTYEQWLLIYEPGHPYLKFVIDNITADILAKRIPPCNQKTQMSCSKYKTLLLTGPDAYSKYINQYIQQYGKLHRNANYNLFARLGVNRDKFELYRHNNMIHYSKISAEEPILR